MARIYVSGNLIDTEKLTGGEIKKLSQSPSGYDLWLANGKGRGDDTKIGDDEAVQLHGGEAFYTAPKEI
jgi:hypothetical protein